MLLEIYALVCVVDVQDTKAQDEFFEKNARDCNGLLIWECISFHVLGKVLNDSKDVPVTTVRAGQWAYNVNRDSLKWGSSVDRSEGTTVARVSIILIAF